MLISTVKKTYSPLKTQMLFSPVCVFNIIDLNYKIVVDED